MQAAYSSQSQVRFELSDELRAWLGLIDVVLTGIEDSAWSMRSWADAVGYAWTVSEDDLRELADELTDSKRGLLRLTRTGFVLGQIAASYRLFSLRAAFLSERKAQRLLERLHKQNARRFYAACTEHGGAFLKVGQVLSARPDLLPKAWVDELSQLQDAAPALPFAVIAKTIEAELRAPLQDLFTVIDEAPLAAASIGQVHRAVTPSGQVVAVKVQRPGMHELVAADLQTLEVFLSSLRGSLPELDYATISDELADGVLTELDYEEERLMTRKLALAFAGDADVTVPEPVDSLCSARVLTTTFVAGRKITSVLDELAGRATRGDELAHAELSRILGKLLAAYLKQILIFGTFQADPHPGNLLVSEQGKLVILDFGCAKTLRPEVRQRYLQLLRAFMMGEQARVAELLAELHFSTRSGRSDTLLVFAEALLSEFRAALASGTFVWPDKHELAARAGKLLAACEDDPVLHIPSEFVMIARVLGTLAGLFSHYRPEIAFGQHILPVLGEALFATQVEAAEPR